MGIKDVAMKSDQASRLVEKFGGRSALARALSKAAGVTISHSTVQSWELNDGFIPAKYHHLVIAAGADLGIEITERDLLARADLFDKSAPAA